MIQEFQGDKESAAEEEFFRWLAGHPKGFVVNCASSGWKLHRAKCPNLWPDDPGVCMTHNRKVCSEERQELEWWAASEGRSVSRCANCPSFRFPWEVVVEVGVLVAVGLWKSRRQFRR